MTRTEARRLNNGVYRVWWKGCSGGQSVAAIGHTKDGDAWIAPANWVTVADYGAYWRRVARVEIIQASAENDAHPHLFTGD